MTLLVKYGASEAEVVVADEGLTYADVLQEAYSILDGVDLQKAAIKADGEPVANYAHVDHQIEIIEVQKPAGRKG